jgi:hypothetical protein
MNAPQKKHSHPMTFSISVDVQDSSIIVNLAGRNKSEHVVYLDHFLISQRSTVPRFVVSNLAEKTQTPYIGQLAYYKASKLTDGSLIAYKPGEGFDVAISIEDDYQFSHAADKYSIRYELIMVDPIVRLPYCIESNEIEFVYKPDA